MRHCVRAQHQTVALKHAGLLRKRRLAMHVGHVAVRAHAKRDEHTLEHCVVAQGPRAVVVAVRAAALKDHDFGSGARSVAVGQRPAGIPHRSERHPALQACGVCQRPVIHAGHFHRALQAHEFPRSNVVAVHAPLLAREVAHEAHNPLRHGQAGGAAVRRISRLLVPKHAVHGLGRGVGQAPGLHGTRHNDAKLGEVRLRVNEQRCARKPHNRGVHGRKPSQGFTGHRAAVLAAFLGHALLGALP